MKFLIDVAYGENKDNGVVIGYYVKCYWISVVHTKAIINIMRKFSFLLPFPTRCELFFNDFDCTIWTEIRSLSYNKCVVSEASFFEKKQTFLQFYFSLNGLSKNTFSHFFLFLIFYFEHIIQYDFTHLISISSHFFQSTKKILLLSTWCAIKIYKL